MKVNEKDKKLLMIVAIVVPIFLCFLVLASQGKKPKQEQQTVLVDAVFTPDGEGEVISSQSKREAYELAEKQKKEKELIHSRKVVSSDHDFYSIDPDSKLETKKQPSEHPVSSSSSVDEDVKSLLQQYEEASASASAPAPAPTTTSAKASTITSTVEKPVKKAKTTAFPAQESSLTGEKANAIPPLSQTSQQTRKSSGITVVRSQTNANNNAGSTSMTASSSAPPEQYTPAVLEQDKEIQNGSNIMFILKEDMATTGGVKFKRGAYLFGKAALNNDFFDIQIYQIKNTDGKVHNVKMLVYDEYYNRGIRSEDILTQTAKKEGLEESSNQIKTSASKTGVSLVDAMVNTGTRVVQRTQSSKPVVVSLKAGYKVNIVESNN